MVFQGKLTPSAKDALREKPKELKKSKSLPPNLNRSKRSVNGSSRGGLKSRVKELGPICKSRNKLEKDHQLAEEDSEFDWVFNKAGQVNQDEFLWLSSESLSPLYSVDERMVYLLSSWASPTSMINLEGGDPLINLESEDSKLISNVVEGESEDLESDFPSPSFNKVGSGGDEVRGELSSNSIAFSNGRFKGVQKRRIVAASRLRASRIVEFKRRMKAKPRKPAQVGVSGLTLSLLNQRSRVRVLRMRKFCAGRALHLYGPTRLEQDCCIADTSGLDQKKKVKPEKMAAERLRTMSLGRVWMEDWDASGWSVSLINLDVEDSQWISEVEPEGFHSDFPSPSFKNHEDTICDHGSPKWDPIFWPYDKDPQNWSVVLDNFNVSPRKDLFGIRLATNPSSVRRPRGGIKRRRIGVSSLSVVRFKHVHTKKGSAKRAKALNSTFATGAMDSVMEDETQEVAVERLVGLREFDGHEGIDMEFQVHNFSILEEYL